MTEAVLRRWRAALALALPACLAVASAQAQAQAQSDGGGKAPQAAQAVTLPPVQVEESGPADSTADIIFAPRSATATKTDMPVLETPQSVSTVTRRQMDEQDPRTVRDALAYTPGVLSSMETTGRYDSIQLRGFGGFGQATDVTDFLDGLKLPRGQAFALPAVDPYLLDRIDVLRGPSAVLYGQTSPGGLVNQVSRAPGPEAAHEARIEGGSFGRAQAGLASRGAIDREGAWQYSFSGIARMSGTRYDDVDEKRLAVAPAVSWQPQEETRLTLRAFYQRDPEGGYFNSIYPTFLAAAPYGAYLDRDLNVGDPEYDSYDRTQYAVGASFDHRFSGLFSIESDLRYAAIDMDMQSLQMAAPLTAAGMLPRQAVRSVEDVGGIAADTRGIFDFRTGAVTHQALVGFDYQQSVSDWEYQFGLAPALDVANPQYGVAVGPLATFIDSRQTLRQTGLYVQEQASLGGFRAVLGARYDWTRQETENRLAGTSSTQSSGDPSYRAALLYAFDFGLSPYVSYATSFEPTVGVDANGDPFVPTEAKQWEAGLKYEPGFADALFAVSAFEIRQKNVLTPGPVPGFNVQQGEIRSRGLEFEARGSLTERLDLIAGLTLLDAEVTESTVANTIGKRPQAVPRHYGSLWADYAVGPGLLDGLSVGGGLRFVGNSYADDANTVSTDGHTLVDAALRYDLGSALPALAGTQATLNVTNLFNKDYYASCSSGFYCQYGDGTQVLAGLRYRW